MAQSMSNWLATKLFVLVLFFCLCALLLQLAVTSVLHRNCFQLWVSKLSPELQISQQKEQDVQGHGSVKSQKPLEKDKVMHIDDDHQLGKYAAIKYFENTTFDSRKTNTTLFTSETWQQMDNYQLILLKRVAFIDRRHPNNSKPMLRFLLYKNHINLKYTGTCLVKYSMQEEFKEIDGRFNLLNLAAKKCPQGGCPWRYEAYYFDCQLKQSNPVTVKFKLIREHPKTTTEISESITHVHESKPAANPEHELAVCVKALFNYDAWLRLMLFIEVYQHLGVSLFMLYNHSTTEDMNQLLNYYINQQKLELIPWPAIPVKDPNSEYFKKFESISEYGQILAHNHCLLSLIGRARHVILVDIDEFIVPSVWNDKDTLKNSILRLLETKSKNKGMIGGFQVRSAYVNMSFPQHGSIYNVSLENLQLPKIFQQFQHFDIQRPGYRCKMILKPESTDKMTVHQPFLYLNNFHEELLKPKGTIYKQLRYNLSGKPANSLL